MTHTLEQWAQQWPESLAVWDERGSLRFQEWNELADRLAEALHRQGVGEGDRVAVRMHLRREWFIANRAIGKLGAEQLALNWRLTPSECVALMTDAGVVALIDDDPDPDPLHLTARPLNLRSIYSVDEASADRARWDQAIQEPAAPPRFGPDQTPLLIFTSGTTGKPKGVSWFDRFTPEPAVLRSYLDAAQPRPAHARALLTLPLHHAGGPAEATAHHRVGGPVFLLGRFDAERALQMIETHRLEYWVTVPTMLLRIQALPEDVLKSYDLSSIKGLFTGGAPVPQELKEWVVATFGEVLTVQYGSTEAAAMTVLRPRDVLRRPGSSGQPLPGVNIRIVAPDWRELPVGETGDIAVNTPGLIANYMGMPPMAADLMSPDRFFRTGDVGHLDADGYLYITGRAKDMIVAGGVNIYPAEIEAALQTHPDIIESAVIGVPDPDMGEQPIAFLEVRPNVTLTLEQVLEFLRPRLAKFKLPRAVVTVDALPRNTIGKVTKNVLREPHWQGREQKI